MASRFETTFGARLRKFEDAVRYVQNWPTYTPEQPELTLPNLETMIMNIKGSNDKQTLSLSRYGVATDVRQTLFGKSQGSIEKILSPIRAAVALKYGRTSAQVKTVSNLIAEYRTSKLVRLPADPANPDQEKTISQSQRSYGSRTKLYADLILNLESFGGYTTTNQALTVTALKAKLIQLNTANDTVATELNNLALSRRERLIQYEQMAIIAGMLKDYASSQYGNRSAEYKSLTSLGI